MPARLPPAAAGTFTLRHAYITVLVMLGVLSVLSNVLLSMQLRATRATAVQITAAAQQRTLALRIAADAEHAVNTRDARGLRDLRVSLQQFEASHAQLSRGAAELYPAGFPDDLRRHYDEVLTPLVTTFTAAARRVAATPALDRTNPDVALLMVQARGPLQAALGRAVGLNSADSERVVTQVQRLSWARVALVLTLLIALGVFMFRPLERRNRLLMAVLTKERNAADRLAAQAQTGREYALLLAELTRTFGSAQDLAELTQAAHRLLGPALSCTTVGLVQLDTAPDQLPLHGPEGEVVSRALGRAGPMNHVLARHPAEPVTVVDDPALHRVGVHAGLVPLPHKPERPSVALLLAASGEHAPVWTPEQQALAQATAQALCAAWERVHLLEELRRRDAYAQALLAVSALTEGERSPQEVAAATVGIMAQVTRIDGAELSTVEQGQRRMQHLEVPALHGYLDALPGLNDRPIQVCSVPLGHAGGRTYELHLRRLDARPWQPADHALFTAAARTVGVALVRQAYLSDIEHAALTDRLTGLPNRRAFEHDLDAALQTALEGETSMALLMIDLDGLKGINDRLGHAAGDALLQAFSHALQRAFRPVDVAYRLGGDEFAVLLAQARPEGRERLLARVEEAAALTRAAGFPETGASAGIAFCPNDGWNATQLVQLADERMYEDKGDRRLRRAVAAPFSG